MSTPESVTVRMDALLTEIALLAIDGQGTQEMWLASVALDTSIKLMKLVWVDDSTLKSSYRKDIDDNIQTLQDYAKHQI
jgi:hypothetical protein